MIKIQFGENFGRFVHWTGDTGSSNQTNCKSYFIL